MPGEEVVKVCEPYAGGYIVDEFPAGPLSGVLTAAKSLGADAIITCPTDTPRIKPTTFKKLVEQFLDNSPSALSVVW